ncbi:hypothetical protein [Variovorax gossypii]|uniref:hypothetical protein n=1 Tax=uncultured Variovorax sp. TaxID=114708 RepID=UPI00261775F7|nr:hypothetical protein [uncultured Variovorax sp.]
MDNNEYLFFEKPAAPVMRRTLVAMRDALASLGRVCTPISKIDHDFERGYGFELEHPAAQGPICVEFMLTDGDERGYGRADDKPECGLLLSALAPDGIFLGDWCPFNYSEQVGTSDPEELVSRVALLEPTSLAAAIDARLSSWADAQLETSEAGEAPRA